MRRFQWTQDLDIGTLDARGHWATMEELLEVVTFYWPRYGNTVMTCKTISGQVNPSDLTFATKFFHCVFVHQSEGISSYDLSVFDGGHG